MIVAFVSSQSLNCGTLINQSIHLNADKTYRTTKNFVQKTQTFKHTNDRWTDGRKASDNNHNN